ncbi:hypothetical protein [Novosphingobium sp. Gsoil 351]|uniref:dCTP deaminase domain-containing protein n=1 Tax=Novosphingobium sp. Gsoil 351 TaxID=2675225 RepID=UPI0018A7FB5E|nr:hypothetical protein [Novosphingobium sp. Gsoil 351]
MATAKAFGFWTFERLLERSTEFEKEHGRPIIAPFFPDEQGRRERASYNMSVGEEIYITPATPDDYKSKELLEARESRAIPPGQFALMHSEEEVWIPKDAIAFITLRSKSTKFRGLVNVSGFYVEPGYRGNLVFAVFNAGPATIHVSRGDKWFEIFFADLTGPADITGKKSTFKGVPTELITPLSDRFHSLPGLDQKIDETRDELDERVQKIERDHSILRWSQGLILGALIALGVRACSESGPENVAAPRADSEAAAPSPQAIAT